MPINLDQAQLMLQHWPWDHDQIQSYWRTDKYSHRTFHFKSPTFRSLTQFQSHHSPMYITPIIFTMPCISIIHVRIGILKHSREESYKLQCSSLKQHELRLNLQPPQHQTMIKWQCYKTAYPSTLTFWRLDGFSCVLSMIFIATWKQNNNAHYAVEVGNLHHNISEW